MADNKKKATFYHSPTTPNLKIAMPSGHWVKFTNGNVCIVADDPLYAEKIEAIEGNPNFGKEDQGARVFKVDKAVPLATAEMESPKPLPSGGLKWHPSGMQKLYPEGKGTWFLCDKCGKKFATLLALESHARLVHGEAYWKAVDKQSHKPILKSFGNAPAGRVIPPNIPVTEPEVPPDIEPGPSMEVPDLQGPTKKDPANK